MVASMVHLKSTFIWVCTALTLPFTSLRSVTFERRCELCGKRFTQVSLLDHLLSYLEHLEP